MSSHRHECYCYLLASVHRVINMAASIATVESKMFWPLFGLVTSLKVLLIPSYHSTDFEVHRNWLAITHSLPVSKWYYEATSRCTLDYPPLFAWFEFCLSHIAKYFDPKMLVVTNLDYASDATVYFQRMSVMVTDLLLVYSTKECCSVVRNSETKPAARMLGDSRLVLAVLLLSNFGLLIIDHIHFQYNGLLFGMLLLSVARISQGRNIEGALWFAILLNFKHIYLYVAPAFIVYLLRSYCFKDTNKDGSVRWFSLAALFRLASLGVIVISVTAVSFGPFILMNQLPQVLSRLFPFKRGLCHAYWAPNFWAMYNIFDKFLLFSVKRAGLIPVNTSSPASMTGGLVHQYEHAVLPSVPPVATFILTVLCMMPSLVRLWVSPSGPKGFIRCLILCAYSSFLFGWHVHEKAVLIIILPLSVLAVSHPLDAKVYLVLATVGHYSLFPLLYTPQEIPIKVSLFCAFTLFSFMALHYIHRSQDNLQSLVSPIESLYLLGLLPLFIYTDVIHPLLGLSSRLPFLPLLMTSVYCSLGVVYSWMVYLWSCVFLSERKAS